MEKSKVIMRGCVPCMVAIGIMYGVTLVALCLFQLVSNPLGWSGSDVPDESVLNYVGIWATGCVHFVYIIVFYKWFCKRTVDSTVEDMRKHLAKRDLLGLITLGVFLQLLVSVLLNYLLPCFPVLNESYQELYESILPGNSIVAFVVTAFLAPVGEELIFRGVTISVMEEHLSFWIVNVVQAFLFGLYHMNLVQFLYAFAIGMVLGSVYKKYRNIKACILVHATINLLANVISFIG